MGGKTFFLAGFVLCLGFGWAAFPRLLYRTAPQPVQFSHKVHTSSAGMKCEDCHSVLADGRFSGIPAVEKCAGCHASPAGSTKDEKLMVEQYITPAKPIPWLVYAKQPDHVYFSHATHVTLAKLSCEGCHGDHGKTGALRRFEYDPITGYSRDLGEPRLLRIGGGGAARPMRMDDCDACHRRNNVQTGCLDCHK